MATDLGIARDYPLQCGTEDDRVPCGVMTSERHHLYDKFENNAAVSRKIRNQLPFEGAKPPDFPADGWTAAGDIARDRGPNAHVSPLTYYGNKIWNPNYQFDYWTDYTDRVREALKGTAWEQYWISTVHDFVCSPDGSFQAKVTLTDQLLIPEARITIFRDAAGRVRIQKDWQQFAPYGDAGNTSTIPSWFEDLPKLTQNEDWKNWVNPYFHYEYTPKEEVFDAFELRNQTMPTDTQDCLPVPGSYTAYPQMPPPPASEPGPDGVAQWPIGDALPPQLSQLSTATVPPTAMDAPVSVFASQPHDLVNLYGLYKGKFD